MIWIVGLFLFLSISGWWVSRNERNLEKKKNECEYHDWDLQWHDGVYNNFFSMMSIGREYHYRCTKCGKIKHKVIYK